MRHGAGMKRMKTLWTPAVAVCVIGLASCGGTAPEDAPTTRVAERPAGTQDLDNAFASEPGEGIAVVNGSAAADISITMPENLDQLSPKLVDELDSRANSGTEAFIATAEADQQAAREGKIDFLTHKLDVKWVQTGPLEGPLTGFLGTYMTYTGGAHPNVAFDVLNWDVSRDRHVVFEDIFEDADAARAHMAGVLKNELLKAKRDRLNNASPNDDDILSTWVNPAFDGNVTVFERFSIARSTDPGKAGGLIYHFAPYEVGSYAEGVYVVGVDYTQFADYISADYADAFGGDAVLP